MPLVQFNNRLFIHNSIEFYTCIKELRGTTNSMLEKCQNIGRVDLTLQQLTQLRKDFKNFNLVLFDQWRADLYTTTTWRKTDIKHSKYYQSPEYLLGGFIDTKPSSYAKWLIPKNKASIFQEDSKTDLTNLGGIQQAEKELNKNVLEIKAPVKKTGYLSKILFKQSNYINRTFYTELNEKLQIYGLILTSPIDDIKTTNLIRPESSLRFRVVHNKYMDYIVLQLEVIRKPGKIETKDAKVTNFSILSTNPKRKVCSKKKMSFQLVDEISIADLRNYNVMKN